MKEKKGGNQRLKGENKNKRKGIKTITEGIKDRRLESKTEGKESKREKWNKVRIEGIKDRKRI